jgi:hypothetical protein
MIMSEKQKEITGLEQKLDFIEQGIRYVKSLIGAERNNPPAWSAVISDGGKEESFDTQIEALKNKIAGYKITIDAKHALYNAMLPEERKDSWAIITQQLEPERQEISRLQLEISTLEHRKFAAFLEQTHQEIRMGLPGNLMELPEGEDPRLLAAYADREETLTLLNKLKQK